MWPLARGPPAGAVFYPLELPRPMLVRSPLRLRVFRLFFRGPPNRAVSPARELLQQKLQTSSRRGGCSPRAFGLYPQRWCGTFDGLGF